LPFQPQKYWSELAEPVTCAHFADSRPWPHSQLLDRAVKVTVTVLVWPAARLPRFSEAVLPLMLQLQLLQPQPQP
jgi:hypothetical protein